MSALSLSSPEVFVAHEESSRSLDDLFAFGKGNVKKSNRVGEDGVDVFEFFFTC